MLVPVRCVWWFSPSSFSRWSRPQSYALFAFCRTICGERVNIFARIVIHGWGVIESLKDLSLAWIYLISFIFIMAPPTADGSLFTGYSPFFVYALWAWVFRCHTVWAKHMSSAFHHHSLTKAVALWHIFLELAIGSKQSDTIWDYNCYQQSWSSVADKVCRSRL